MLGGASERRDVEVALDLMAELLQVHSRGWCIERVEEQPLLVGRQRIDILDVLKLWIVHFVLVPRAHIRGGQLARHAAQLFHV